MDAIFKALNDPARRALLDSLRCRDGQTLSELVEQFEMTRFGVMKHLGLLEEAGLITTKKDGRFKYHYLNAVPLQEVIDRWIEPLIGKPSARHLIALKTKLEGDDTMSTQPDFIHQTFIRTSRDVLWDTINSANSQAEFHFAASSSRQLECGGIEMIREDGSVMLTQRIIKSDPKSRLEMSFEPNWEGADTSSKVVYLIEEEGPVCKLTCEHYGIKPGLEGVKEGWARWTASLKSYLENGTPIKMAS